MEPLDLYCERLGPGLWSEPINALTNLAFFLAAWAGWRLARQTPALTPGIWLLVGLTAAIGTGSLVFHTVATSWARVLDVVPILLFQLVYLWLYGREIMGIGRSSVAGLVLALLAAALVGRSFPQFLNGSLTYAPGLLFVFGLGIHHLQTARRERFGLLAATLAFVVSLLFRTIDEVLCPVISIGTHYLWHLGNAVVVYLLLRALIFNWPRVSGG